MQFPRHIFGWTMALFLFASFPSSSLAQSSLDDIKARLESEGISVVDYSAPQGKWGSLPKEWIEYLSEDYENLADLASDFEGNFVGKESITDLRRQLDKAVAEKSRLTIKEDIDLINLKIASLKEEIENLEENVKNQILNIIGSSDVTKINPVIIDKAGGANLIFNEIDFFYTYQKWGRLPTRIIILLEEAGYKSLQDLADVANSDVPAALASVQGLRADDVRYIEDSMAALSTPGESQANGIARGVADTIKNIVFGLAIVWLMVAGVRMIMAQGEETVIKEQKVAIIYVLVGLAAILLVDRSIDFLYGPLGVARKELMPDDGFTLEIYGAINFIKALIGIIAIVFIILSGVRMIFAIGAEDEIKKQKSAIVWVAAGLVLIAINQVLVENFFIFPAQNSDQIDTSNVIVIINTLGSVFQWALGFVGLFAFGALVYGAANLVMNFGNDEMVENAKKIIKHALIGIMVILSAYVIIATLVVFK